jgi:hypothetical protein
MYCVCVQGLWPLYFSQVAGVREVGGAIEADMVVDVMSAAAWHGNLEVLRTTLLDIKAVGGVRRGDLVHTGTTCTTCTCTQVHTEALTHTCMHTNALAHTHKHTYSCTCIIKNIQAHVCTHTHSRIHIGGSVTLASRCWPSYLCACVCVCV